MRLACAPRSIVAAEAIVVNAPNAIFAAVAALAARFVVATPAVAIFDDETEPAALESGVNPKADVTCADVTDETLAALPVILIAHDPPKSGR